VTRARNKKVMSCWWWMNEFEMVEVVFQVPILNYGIERRHEIVLVLHLYNSSH